MDAVTQAPIGGATVISGTAATDRAITLNALIDAYIMNYTGRDKARHHRVGRWRSRLGERAVTSISDEDVFQALEAYAERSPVLAALAPVANFGLLLPLAAFGVCIARRAGRRLWVPLACALSLAASVVLFFVVGRYRMGLVPFLAPIAGAGLVELVALVRARRFAELGPPAACAAAAAVLAWAPLEEPGDPRATTYSNLASELLRRADFAGAERWAREAVLALPPGELRATLRFAGAAAALNVTRTGANPPRRDEVARFLGSV